MHSVVLDVLYALSLELGFLCFEAVDNLSHFLIIFWCQWGLLVNQIRIHLTNIHENCVWRGICVEHMFLHFWAKSVEYHLSTHNFARIRDSVLVLWYDSSVQNLFKIVSHVSIRGESLLQRIQWLLFCFLLIRAFGVKLSLGLSKLVECFRDSLNIIVDVLTEIIFAKFDSVFFDHLRWGSLEHGKLNLVIWRGYAIYHQVGHGVWCVIIIICISFLLLNAWFRIYVKHRLWFINLLRHRNVWISRTLLVNKILHKARFWSLRFLNDVQHLLFVEWRFLNVPANRWIWFVRVFLIS